MINQTPRYLYCSNPLTGNNRLIAIDQDDKIEIVDKEFQRTLGQSGISIPVFKRPSFEGRKVIYLDNTDSNLFRRAFLEVYYPMCLSKKTFIWEELSDEESTSLESW